MLMKDQNYRSIQVGITNTGDFFTKVNITLSMRMILVVEFVLSRGYYWHRSSEYVSFLFVSLAYVCFTTFRRKKYEVVTYKHCVYTFLYKIQKYQLGCSSLKRVYSFKISGLDRSGLVDLNAVIK